MSGAEAPGQGGKCVQLSRGTAEGKCVQLSVEWQIVPATLGTLDAVLSGG